MRGKDQLSISTRKLSISVSVTLFNKNTCVERVGSRLYECVSDGRNASSRWNSGGWNCV